VVELHIVQRPLEMTAEQFARLFRAITGREPDPRDLAEAMAKLARKGRARGGEAAKRARNGG